MSNRIISTTVYNRHIVAHIAEDVIENVRVISSEKIHSIGTIALGRVVKMIPATGACFVDIGDDTNYFVKIPNSLNDIIFSDNQNHSTLHCEDQILIQISSEAIKSKAPSATTQISLNGRYFVLEQGKGLSISKKITETARKKLVLPDNIKDVAKKYHVIVRTEAVQVSDSALLDAELNSMTDRFDRILSKAKTCLDRTVLYEPEVPLVSIISSWMRYNPDEFLTDNEEDYELIAGSQLDINTRLYTDDNLSIIKLYKLETLLDTVLAKKVYLKSGAFLVVEQGETLTAIDVNSAHVVTGDKKDIAYKVNIEAAEEIGHILKSRNISGMILIDFINMKDVKHENQLIEKVEQVIFKDPIQTTYIDMTGLGLMELTRKRTYKSFAEQWKQNN